MMVSNLKIKMQLRKESGMILIMNRITNDGFKIQNYSNLKFKMKLWWQWLNLTNVATRNWNKSRMVINECDDWMQTKI